MTKKRSISQQKNSSQNKQVVVTSTGFEGPIPPPAVLEAYENLTPGAADRILQMAELESEHRREIERNVAQANIDNTESQLRINSKQSRSAFLSDLIGQICGLIVSLACIAGAVYLAPDEPWVAGALAAIPSAAVIQAFFAKRHSTESARK